MDSKESITIFSKLPKDTQNKLINISTLHKTVQEKIFKNVKNMEKPTKYNDIKGKENGYLLISDDRTKIIHDKLSNKIDTNYSDALYNKDQYCKFEGQKVSEIFDELLERIGNNKIPKDIPILLIVKSGNKVKSLYKVIGVSFTNRNKNEKIPPYIDMKLTNIDLSKYKYERQKSEHPNINKLLAFVGIDILLRNRSGINPIKIENKKFTEDINKL